MISKDLIEIWEAVLTFLFFPLLVIIAYSPDKGWLNVIFCQDQAKLSTKQQQIELGTVMSVSLVSLLSLTCSGLLLRRSLLLLNRYTLLAVRTMGSR